MKIIGDYKDPKKVMFLKQLNRAYNDTCKKVGYNPGQHFKRLAILRLQQGWYLSGEMLTLLMDNSTSATVDFSHHIKFLMNGK